MSCPRITRKPPQTVAVVTSKGDPNVVGEQVFPALYGAVYTLKMALKKEGKDFKVTGLRARWPDAHLLPKDEWTAHWALPIPDGTPEVPQKHPETEVRVEVWEYGEVAETLHIGPYTEEGPTITALHRFIEEQGREISGPHEEEYLTSPRAKVQKTIIRYQVMSKTT
ncbi:MAG: GyrI-like domain-containing protein [Armatimonadota bacterium]